MKILKRFFGELQLVTIRVYFELRLSLSFKFYNRQADISVGSLNPPMRG